MTSGERQRPVAPGPRPAIVRGRAFTLIELLVTLSIVALLISLLLPSLAGARASARTAACLSNQRQLLLAWTLYAHDHRSAAMPLELDAPDALVYWFGSVALADAAVDHARGHLAPYLAAGLHERSIYECPTQPWGSYRPQPLAAPPPGRPTTTYGYNGYYLCPAGTPGWRSQIGQQRWKALADFTRPAELLVFADTLLPGTPPRNTALLDPPMLFDGSDWSPNSSPTTCFRHPGTRATDRGSARSVLLSTAAARADGSARTTRAEPDWLTHPTLGIGSVGAANDPAYVPDWRSWR